MADQYTPLDPTAHDLKCPDCESTDKASLIVFSAQWHPLLDLSVLVPGTPPLLPDENDTVECRAEVDPGDDGITVCGFRSALIDFVLCGQGETINPAAADNDTHGFAAERTPLAAAPAQDEIDAEMAEIAARPDPPEGAPDAAAAKKSRKKSK